MPFYNTMDDQLSGIIILSFIASLVFFYVVKILIKNPKSDDSISEPMLV